MTVLKSYAGGARATTLVSLIDDEDTTMVVVDGSTYPTGAGGPFVISLGRGSVNEEKVLIGSRSTNNLIVEQRGYDGTMAVSHSAGQAVEHVLDANSMQDLNTFATTMTARGDLLVQGAVEVERLAKGLPSLPLVAGANDPAYTQLGSAGIADSAVTTAKVNNRAVTLGKLGNASGGPLLGYGSTVVTSSTGGLWGFAHGLGVVPTSVVISNGDANAGVYLHQLTGKDLWNATGKTFVVYEPSPYVWALQPVPAFFNMRINWVAFG